MGDRITNGVNPGPLQVQISMLPLFAVFIHSGTSVLPELPDSFLLFCLEIICKPLLGKQTGTGNVAKTMRVHVVGVGAKTLLRQLLW